MVKRPTTARIETERLEELDEFVENSEKIENRAQAIRYAIRRVLDE